MRLVELRRAWDDGFLSARWFPDLNYGQGYPFLSFYAPLLFWIAGLLHVLGANLADALKLATALGVVAAAFGADRLVREGLRTETGEAPSAKAAGFAAAALFVYAPYAVRDLFIRGDLAESLGMGLLPWSLWGLLRLRRARTPRDVALSAALGAGPILAHNVIGLFNGIALALTGVIVVLTSSRKKSAAIAAIVSGAGTLLLASFFWAPALLEKRFVQIDRMTTGEFNYTHHFVTWGQLLGRGEFPGEGQGLPMSFELGWVGLAGVALAALFARPLWREHRSALFLGVFLFFGGAARTTEMSRPVYEAIEWLRAIQFPWRFLSIASLGAALLGGLGLGQLLASRGARSRNAATTFVALAAIGLVAPLLGPKPNFPLPAWSVDPAKFLESRETTTKGEYLPMTATEIERPRGFEGGVKLEGEGRVVRAERRTGRIDADIETSGPAELVLQDLYFPGWTVRVDGERVPVSAEVPSGRMRITIPVRSSRVEARLEPTPVRRVTAALSSLTALLLLLAALLPHSPSRAARDQA